MVSVRLMTRHGAGGRMLTYPDESELVGSSRAAKTMAMCSFLAVRRKALHGRTSAEQRLDDSQLKK
jgi:hypothetical protein